MIETLRLSAYLCTDGIPHLDILAWDVPLSQLLNVQINNPPVSIDASRLGMRDEEVEALFESPLVNNLHWLNLAGNHAITQAVLPVVCEAVRDKHLPLAWLDLRGTDANATPYLDPEPGFLRGQTCYWRMPLMTHRLAELYGAQTWMTLGNPLEEESEISISANNYPPNRMNYGFTP